MTSMSTQTTVQAVWTHGRYRMPDIKCVLSVYMQIHFTMVYTIAQHLLSFLFLELLGYKAGCVVSPENPEELPGVFADIPSFVL